MHAEGTLGPLIADDPSTTELALAVRVGWPSGATLKPLVPFDLSMLGRAEGRFGLDGTLASLRLHDGSLETSSTAGIKLVATGAIASVRTSPSFAFDGLAFAIDAKAPSTSALARQLDVPCPDFGPLRASAKLLGGPAPLALSNIRLAVGAGPTPSISASGAIGDVIAFEKLELTGDFKLPATELLACADIHGSSDTGRLVGKLHLSDGDGSFGLEHLEAEIKETDLLSLTMAGAIDDLDKLDQVSFQTSLEIPRVADLAAVFDASDIGLEGFRFDGTLTGGAQRFDADGQATLGETGIHGSVSGDFRGARPRFNARLDSPKLRLADLGLTPADVRDRRETRETERAQAGVRRYLFTREPIPLAALDKADLDLEVKIDVLEGVVLAVDKATAHVVVQDGKLQVSPAQFAVVGGRAQLDAEVDARAPTPTWRIKAEADDLALGDVWRQLNTEVPLSGEFDMLLDLQASGRSPRDLASSLDGDLHLALQRGQIRSRLFGLTTMNPLRWLTARSTRQGYSKVDCFIASFRAEKGDATLRKLLLDTPEATAIGTGSINFAAETINILIQPSSKGSVVGLATPFTITGNLADPSVQASAAGATARAVGRVVAGPVNFLGSLLSLIDDRGQDRNNPCVASLSSELGTP